MPLSKYSNGQAAVVSPTIQSIELGPVRLAVSSLEQTLHLYREILSMPTRPTSDGGIAVGPTGHPLYQLHEEPAAKPRAAHTTGLYHVALLVPTRADLAKVLRRLIETGYPLEGAADHGVSEAIYLSDPEGNGMEIYRDRPRQEWPYTGGTLAMVTDPLDVDGLLSEAEPHGAGWQGMAEGTRVGHIHLQVGDLDPAVQFYQDVLGFDLMQRFGRSAAFLSVGGYHHQIGLNTWAGVGAAQPPTGTRGLRGFALYLSTAAEVEATVGRMAAAEWEFTRTAGSVVTHDPAGNLIQLAPPERRA